MLLDIYLISTALSMGISLFSAYTAYKKLEREGYKHKKEELSIPERIMQELKIYSCFLIPILNVVFASVIFLKFDEFYEKMKEKLLKEGNLIKIQKQNKNEIKDNVEEFELNKNDAEYNMPLRSLDDDIHKRFEEMTRDEKVAYLESLKKSILEMPENKSKEKTIPSKVCVIFKDEEEEKRFSEIASMINHAQDDSQEKINVYRKKL